MICAIRKQQLHSGCTARLYSFSTAPFRRAIAIASLTQVPRLPLAVLQHASDLRTRSRCCAPAVGTSSPGPKWPRPQSLQMSLFEKPFRKPCELPGLQQLLEVGHKVINLSGACRCSEFFTVLITINDDCRIDAMLNCLGLPDSDALVFTIAPIMSTIKARSLSC